MARRKAATARKEQRTPRRNRASHPPRGRKKLPARAAATLDGRPQAGCAGDAKGGEGRARQCHKTGSGGKKKTGWKRESGAKRKRDSIVDPEDEKKKKRARKGAMKEEGASSGREKAQGGRRGAGCESRGEKKGGGDGQAEEVKEEREVRDDGPASGRRTLPGEPTPPAGRLAATATRPGSDDARARAERCGHRPTRVVACWAIADDERPNGRTKDGWVKTRYRDEGRADATSRAARHRTPVADPERAGGTTALARARARREIAARFDRFGMAWHEEWQRKEKKNEKSYWRGE